MGRLEPRTGYAPVWLDISGCHGHRLSNHA
jgi:hypothetical protein